MKKLLIISLSFLVVLSFSINFVIAAGTCSGTLACNYPKEPACITHCGCAWSGSCAATSGGCSDCSDETSCTGRAGCTWTESVIPPEGGGGVQSVIGIFPRTPLGGDLLYSETVQLKVEIFFAGEPTNNAIVKANSSMFGEITLEHKRSFPDGIYMANVTIKDVEPGSKRIIYIVEQSAQYNEAFILVELKPSLEISTEIDEMYYKDNLIRFNGTVFNKDQKPENNSIVKISGYLDEDRIFHIETFTNNEGKFYSEYLIKHGDPEGNWKILIEAESEEKESGSKLLSTKINVPAGVLYYSVNFLSPLKEKTFRRGEVVPITVEVKEINQFVEGASVIIYTPSEESITLKEIGDGKYSGNYVIKPNDLMGDWFLKTEAKKQIGEFTKVGGANMPLTIGPTEIKFNILSPVSDVIYTNSRLKIKVKLTYSDGSIVKGADLNAILSNETIPLLEVSDGIYEGSHFIETKDVGTLNIQISAEDINENFGSLNETVFVRKRSFIGNILAFILDMIKQYWWAFLTFLIAVFLIYQPSLEISWIKRKIKKLKKEQENIKAMQIETEKKYYKEGVITEKEFRNIMEKYEERLAKTKEDETIYNKKLTQELKKVKNKIILKKK